MVERPTKHTVPFVETVEEVVLKLAEFSARTVQYGKRRKDVG
jgi:hypothetical protein